MGDRAGSKERQEELVKEFEDLERERIGVGTHEKPYEPLHRFKAIYLG
jgi:hypothetical protein